MRLLLPSLLLFGVSTLAQSPPCTTSPAINPPAPYHCGDQGTLKTPSVLATTTVVDQTACRDACFAKKKCVSFSFNTDTKQCITATASVIAQGFKKSTTSHVFYWNKKHCYVVNCPTCPSGENYCSASLQCANLQTDSLNCGSCGTICPLGQSCSSGSCGCSTAGQSICSGSCTDTSSDVNNCGSCGNSCALGQVCTSGSCGCPVPSDSLCGGLCTDTSSDSDNCGSCGTSCPSDQSCIAGSCSCTVFGQSLCGGTCLDTSSDSDNCGTCGNVCPSGTSCSGGSCTCNDSSLSLCGDSCLDFSSDHDNCGSCGNTCSSSETCISGSCASCSGTSPRFQLSARNSGCGFSGGFPYYIGNDGKGDYFDMSTGQGPLVSPVFYLQYGTGPPAADGTCSGNLMEIVTGSEVQIGFTDAQEIGDYYVTFNKRLNLPTYAGTLDCSIDATTDLLTCTESNTSGVWFACCAYWRWGFQSQVGEYCATFDMAVLYQ